MNSTKPNRVSLHPSGTELIKGVSISNHDREELAKIKLNPEDIKNDFFDYSKVVVKKPWGYEYLIFANEVIAVWVLYLKNNAQTSMHCHPGKKTSLVVLDGEVTCSTLSEDIKRQAGEGLLIGKGVFHQTTARSEHGAFVMEIETPVNKRDLARLKDRYGRAGKGYETEDQHSFNTQNYNYISFNNLEIQHNLKKRFGHCSLTFKKLTDEKNLDEVLDLDPEDVLCLLKGTLLDSDGKPVVEVGDTMAVASLRQFHSIRASRETEMMLIKKIDRVIKISDYVADFLFRQNLKPVFVVPGEANVHLLDSIGRHEGLPYLSTQIESSASRAVEAFSKLRLKPGALIVSLGASSANCLPGVVSSWVDSVPMLVISGQARTDQDTSGSVRQLGNHTLPIVDIVKPITKYAVKVTEPNMVRYHLEKALYLAKEGKQGPAWVELPIDIQGMTVDADELRGFDPSELAAKPVNLHDKLPAQIQKVVQLLKGSVRPVILAGNGIRSGFAESRLHQLVDRLKIPILTSRRGADLISDDHPLFFGRPGTYGQRSANFVIQNCDLLISIGSRLSIPLIGRNTPAFARAAQKVVVDIDPAELEKPTVKPEIPIAADADVFMRALLEALPEKLPDYGSWIQKCQNWRKQFPPDSYGGPSLAFKGEEESSLIYPLPLIRTLSNELKENDVIIADGGPALIYTLLAFRFKKGQRLINATGLELPGFALAGAMGACMGLERKPVICICEDRGFQISIQELQTILDYQLPIKTLILKSKGHSIIRNIQKDYFGSRFVGTDNAIRLGSAPLIPIIKAFGFPTFEISEREQLRPTLREWLNTTGPAVCEVHTENDQEKMPRPGFTIRDDQKWIAKPLEDMYPLLDRQVLREIMLIDPVQED